MDRSADPLPELTGCSLLRTVTKCRKQALFGVIDTNSDAEKEQRYQLTGISSDGCRFSAQHTTWYCSVIRQRTEHFNFNHAKDPTMKR